MKIKQLFHLYTVRMLDGKIVANKLPSLPAKPTFLDVKKKKIREEQLVLNYKYFIHNNDHCLNLAGNS